MFLWKSCTPSLGSRSEAVCPFRLSRDKAHRGWAPTCFLVSCLPLEAFRCLSNGEDESVNPQRIWEYPDSLTWAFLPPAPFARLGELLPNKGFCEHHGDHVGVFLRNPGSLGSRSSSGFYHSTAIRKERPVCNSAYFSLQLPFGSVWPVVSGVPVSSSLG